MTRRLLALLGGGLLASGCRGSELEGPRADPSPAVQRAEVELAEPRSAPARGWLKGQLHLHSNASGDSDTPAADVVRWYAEHDYDFIVFTDHNRIVDGPASEDVLVLPGVEITQNLDTCSPPPQRGHQCLLHVNALVLDPEKARAGDSVVAPDSDDRVERYAFAMAVTEAMGGVAQLNHPNFHYGASREQIAALTRRGLRLLEVANEAWDSNNEGDRTHPSTMEIWDAVLTEGGRLYGTATDDAHHYDDAATRQREGKPIFVGDLGFVMVDAAREPAAIREALQQGRFYASTGVLLDDVSFHDGVLEVRVSAETATRPSISFIVDGGVVVHTVQGSAARFDTRGRDHGYVRAVVTDRQGHHAWVQPVFLDDRP